MEKMKNAMAAAMALALVLNLAACAGSPEAAGAGSQGSYTERPAVQVQTPAAEPATESVTEHAAKPDTGSEPAVEPAASSKSTSSRKERLERIKKLMEQKKQEQKQAPEREPAAETAKTEGSAVDSAHPDSAAGPETCPEPEAPTASPSIKAIAALGELQAGVEEEYYTHTASFVVDVENGHNPYDVAWDYGELYDVYIEEADWPLVFDADFYMKSFPALAFLYHYDEELLLEHFQTVGIHEGRQGNKAFNVATYQKNCKKELRDAFGDHYECYYFYWMLNQASQKDVKTSGKNDPLQLCVKMTSMQAEEFKKVNEYRAEAGVESLKFDPELAAIACYRGWVDISEGYGAHDWLDADGERAGGLLDLIHTNWLAENTVDSGVKDSTQGILATFYINYRYSPEHYEAMINPKCSYFGCSHIYFGTNRIPEERRKSNATTKPMMRVEFDLFTDTLSTPMHP